LSRKKFFGSEYEARKYLSEDPDRDEYQIRYRHIQDDYVVEPKDESMERKNPRFGNPSKRKHPDYPKLPIRSQVPRMARALKRAFDSEDAETKRLANIEAEVMSEYQHEHPLQKFEGYEDQRDSTLRALQGQPSEKVAHVFRLLCEGSSPEQALKRAGLKKSSKIRQNPGELLVVNPEPDSAKAERVYEMWHKKEPHAVHVMDTGCDGDDLMICVGKAHNIVYRSGKWEHGKKTNDYVHHFDSKPYVYMLAHLVEPMARENPGKGKTVESLLSRARNKDGQYAVADLATPLSFGLDDGKDGTDIAIHNGSRVYGAVDQKTVIITDPKWKLIVIKGGEMHFDERGIVK
jgi:hypothetical protein